MNYYELSYLLRWLKAIGITTFGQLNYIVEEYRLYNKRQLLDFAQRCVINGWTIKNIL